LLRASCVVRLLTDNGVAPLRLVASGRGAYQPWTARTPPEALLRNDVCS